MDGEKLQVCGSDGFNYCRFSKVMVSIVLFPMVAWIVSSLFSSVLLKVLASAIVIGWLIGGAIWLDNVPVLQKKICKPKEQRNG